MIKDNISFDSEDYRNLQRIRQQLRIRWTIQEGIRELGPGYPITRKENISSQYKISCFSLRNMLVDGYQFNTMPENEQVTYELFEKYVYYLLYDLCYDVSINQLNSWRKRKIKRSSTKLIIDEYGIGEYEGIQLYKLSFKQVNKKCGIIADIFKEKQDAVFYIPEKHKRLPIGSVLRIRKGVKISYDTEGKHYGLYDWGIGSVNCKLDSDEEIYLRFTNPAIWKDVPSCHEVISYIDFGNQNAYIHSRKVTPIGDLIKEYKGEDVVSQQQKTDYYISPIRYKSFLQGKESYYIGNYCSTWFNIDIDLHSSPAIRTRIQEVIRQKEEEALKEEERRKAEEERKRREIEARLEKFRYNKRNRHSRDYYITFDEAKHTYTVDGKILQSVTNIVENCFPKFDAELHAKYTAAKMGITPEKVIMMWEQKGKESRELGTAMHQKIENYYKGQDSWEDDSYRLFKMFAEKNELVPYRTEWAVYDTDHNIAGTIDFVDYQNGEYTIYDWKRSDKIIANGMPVKVSKYQEKGLYPLEHLENCAYYHYALQLSLYKFILERNYNMKISKLRLGIFHPTYDKPYVLEVPYLENEVNTLMGLRSEVNF